MKTSPAGRKLIMDFEGLNPRDPLAAYLCPAGVPTIGYGHTKNVNLGARLSSLQEAEQILESDLIITEQQVTDALQGAPVTQSQFDAMVSLLFNIGPGGFNQSTVLRKHKAGEYVGAANAFGLWNKATVDGQLVALPGLTRRRAAETALYLQPSHSSEPNVPYIEDISMPQKVEPPKELPKGFERTDEGNIVLKDIKESTIVKEADSGKNIGILASIGSVVAPIIASLSGLHWDVILAIGGVFLVFGLLYAIYQLIKIKFTRVKMNKDGIA